MSFRLERLSDQHLVHLFTCGKRPGAEEIDAFLKSRALDEQKQGLSSTTVAVAASSGEIAGFYTLSPLSIGIDDSVRRGIGLRDGRYSKVGGFLLGRLGVSAAHQGKGFGPMLVERAIDAALSAQRTAGGAFLAVDPKNDRLLSWYLALDFGFVQLDARRRRVVMRLA